MPLETTPAWSADDIAAHCRRYGLTLPAAMLARMHELSANVTRTGLAIPRQPIKDNEPALVFAMPTPTPIQR
ncbi:MULTISPECIES: hypothetical protein [unclassified Achromobacter]|uniref:hypothetical protein n=1 Tax=unclassified Achromobacter TaxID=2626865 RepID=UPI000B5187ED|nr:MULTISPECIES: hypothetical protein [unclassified Achromobacter]OWT75458.1 hypothetical protein CEY04_17900 [Achromobacter sp. HZ28]OWT76118.1 hypothetical protein CEY05_13350 [Achromobacter sp. HZ34]